MKASHKLQDLKAARAFMLRLGQAKRTDDRYDRETIPLFPLLLIMQADGSLTRDAERLAHKVQAWDSP